MQPSETEKQVGKLDLYKTTVAKSYLNLRKRLRDNLKLLSYMLPGTCKKLNSTQQFIYQELRILRKNTNLIS